MLRNGRFKIMRLGLTAAAFMLVRAACYAATIANVTVSAIPGGVIATAPSGEIAPPPAAPLTLSNVTWNCGHLKPKECSQLVLTYLQKTVKISATAVGRPWGGEFTITGISGDDKTVKLAPTPH
jgi:hypothetical protein